MTQTSPVTPSPETRIPDQSIAETLQRIEERLARVERSLERASQSVDTAPAFIATAVDTVDDLARMAEARGIDIDARVQVLARVLERLTSPEALSAVESLLAKVDSLKAVLASGVLDPSALATVATAGDALAKAASAPSEPMGLWTAFRASSDPEVQTALGFFVRFAHAFGADLHAPKLLTSEIR